MANRFWVGGSANWDGTAGTKWATTSGGSGGAAVPTVADDVFLDGNSGASTVTIATANALCRSLNCTGFTGTLAGSLQLQIGDATAGASNIALLLSAAMTVSLTGTISFLSTSTTLQSITSNGKSYGGAVTFNGSFASSGGNWQFMDDFSLPGKILTITAGALKTNNHNVTCSAMSSFTSGQRTLDFGSSTFTMSVSSGSIVAWDLANNNLTMNANTVSLVFNGAISQFGPAGQTYGGTITFNGATNSISGTNVTASFSTARIIAAQDSTLTVIAGSTITLTGGASAWPSGVSGHLVTILSSSNGTPYTVSSAITLVSDYISLRDCTGAGAGTPHQAGAHSTNVSGNTLWTFAPLASGTITVGAIGGTTLSLSISSATGGTGPYFYQWYRSIDANFTPGPSNILTGATSTTLNDTGLTKGETYAYRVKTTDSAPNAVDSVAVTATTLAYQIVFDGNSLTFGTGSTGGNDYPSQTMPFLGTAWHKGGNFGVGGQTTLDMIADAATQIDVLVDNATYIRNVLVAWEGRNDIVINHATGAQAYANMVTYCLARRAAGWKVVVPSITPSSGDSEAADFETQRQAYNALMKANWRAFADGYADLSDDTRIGQSGDELNGVYYFDRVHMVDLGYGVVAQLVAAIAEVAATGGETAVAKSVFGIGQQCILVYIPAIVVPSIRQHLGLGQSVFIMFNIPDVEEVDCYGTLSRANAYFNRKLRNQPWVDSYPDDRKKALIEATRIVDSLNYAGVKADPTQEHQFPRSTLGYVTISADGSLLSVSAVADASVPQDIEYATYEIAIKLLDGIDPDLEAVNVAKTSQGFSSARTTYDRAFVLAHIAAGIPSFSAWKLLRQYLRSGKNIFVSRAS